MSRELAITALQSVTELIETLSGENRIDEGQYLAAMNQMRTIYGGLPPKAEDPAPGGFDDEGVPWGPRMTIAVRYAPLEIPIASTEIAPAYWRSTAWVQQPVQTRFIIDNFVGLLANPDRLDTSGLLDTMIENEVRRLEWILPEGVTMRTNVMGRYRFGPIAPTDNSVAGVEARQLTCMFRSHLDYLERRGVDMIAGRGIHGPVFTDAAWELLMTNWNVRRLAAQHHVMFSLKARLTRFRDGNRFPNLIFRNTDSFSTYKTKKHTHKLALTYTIRGLPTPLKFDLWTGLIKLGGKDLCNTADYVMASLWEHHGLVSESLIRHTTRARLSPHRNANGDTYLMMKVSGITAATRDKIRTYQNYPDGRDVGVFVVVEYADKLNDGAAVPANVITHV